MHNDYNISLLEKGLCGKRPVYPHKPATLNGVALQEFCIVFANREGGFEKTVAEMLSARIFDLLGERVPFCSDETPVGKWEILIGNTNRQNSASAPLGAAIVALDRGVMLSGATANDLGLAAKAFLEELNTAVMRGDAAVHFSGESKIAPVEVLSLMGYNFYGFHAYQTRMDNLCRVITKYLPDVLCIQEPDLAMMELTHVNLDAYYDYYNGTPRHGEEGSDPLPDAKGANSVAPILYNRERFRLISADTKWMSDTPDVPSKYADSMYYRHFSYVELEDRVTQKRFVAVNLHLQRGTAVRQMHVVFDHLNRLFARVPVFLIGDFNNEGDKPVLYQMREIAGFASAHDTAKRILDGHNRIDWIMYTKDCVEAQLYHCCTETYPDPDDKKGYYHQRTPSDHFAFYAEVTFLANVDPVHDWTEASKWEQPPVQE